MNPVVDPATPTNPNYALLGTSGANTVTLNTSQIPSHTHVATVTDPGHIHFTVADFVDTTGALPTPLTSIARESTFGSTDEEYALRSAPITVASLGLTNTSLTGVTVTNAAAGTGSAHSNIQPVLACYYIMYIP